MPRCLPKLPSPLRAAPARPQRGAVLEVALIILLLVAVVGLAAARGTFLQDKMSANFYDRQIAFQAAQAALRQGEAAAKDAPAGGAGAAIRDCSPGATLPCPPDPFAAGVPGQAVDHTTAFPGTYEETPAGRLVNDLRLEYIVEYLGSFDTPASDFQIATQCSSYTPCNSKTSADFYRVTARSGPASGIDRATVTLQSVYRR